MVNNADHPTPATPEATEREARGLLLSHGACMEDYGLIGDASVIENGRTEYARLLDAYRGAILAARDTEWREAVEAVRARATIKPSDSAIERAALGLVRSTLDALLAKLREAK